VVDRFVKETKIIWAFGRNNINNNKQ